MKRPPLFTLTKAFAILVTTGLLLTAGQSVLAAESGCVTCHLDVDMLEETAAPVTAKKSAMQSGAG